MICQRGYTSRHAAGIATLDLSEFHFAMHRTLLPTPAQFTSLWGRTAPALFCTHPQNQLSARSRQDRRTSRAFMGKKADAPAQVCFFSPKRFSGNLVAAPRKAYSHPQATDEALTHSTGHHHHWRRAHRPGLGRHGTRLRCALRGWPLGCHPCPVLVGVPRISADVHGMSLPTLSTLHGKCAQQSSRKHQTSPPHSRARCC